MKRRRLLTLLLGLPALPLAGTTTGCRRPDHDARGRTLIRYMAWGNPEQIRAEGDIIKEFERKNPGIAVKPFLVPGSAYADKLQLMLASRTEPDVMRCDHYLFPALVRKKYFLPLQPLIDAEPKGFLDDFVPTALEEGTYQGALYAMNVLFGGVMLYYNKKLFAAAGLPDPYATYKQGKWNWDAFVDAATALTKRDTSGRAEQFGTSVPDFPMNASVFWNFGGQIADPGITRLTLADDPGAVAGMQAWVDLRWKHRCAPTPGDSALSAFTFQSGKLGMAWGWAGESPTYRKIKDFEWDIVPTPAGPAGDATVIKGNQIVISKHSAHPEAAWEFVKFMTGPEAELILGAKLRRTIPTRRSVQNDPRYRHTDKPPFHTDVFLETIRRGRTLPIDARYNEWVVEFRAALDPLLNVAGANKDARLALQEAATRANRILGGEEGF